MQGRTLDEAQMLLSSTVSEIVRRGGIPFVIGDCSSQIYHTTLGVISSCGGGEVGVVSVSPTLGKEYVHVLK